MNLGKVEIWETSLDRIVTLREGAKGVLRPFEFSDELPPTALLDPRIQTRHFRRPEGSAAAISWHYATQARSSQGLTSIKKFVARASKLNFRKNQATDAT